jgi:hypothetical protein
MSKISPPTSPGMIALTPPHDGTSSSLSIKTWRPMSARRPLNKGGLGRKSADNDRLCGNEPGPRGAGNVVALPAGDGDDLDAMFASPP